MQVCVCVCLCRCVYSNYNHSCRWRSFRVSLAITDCIPDFSASHVFNWYLFKKLCYAKNSSTLDMQCRRLTSVSNHKPIKRIGRGRKKIHTSRVNAVINSVSVHFHWSVQCGPKYGSSVFLSLKPKRPKLWLMWHNQPCPHLVSSPSEWLSRKLERWSHNYYKGTVKGTICYFFCLKFRRLI